LVPAMSGPVDLWKGALAAAPAAAAPLPCQNSNNSTGNLRTFQSNHRKTAAALAMNVGAFVAKHGIERVGFLTLTFAEHIVCPKEAQKRWNSLRGHVLNERYEDWLRVFERQESARIHYHVLVSTQHDIRTGIDWAQIKARNYTSASPALRAEWAFWRKTAPDYRFGRTELLPIKSSAEAMAFYVGKYVAKHIGNRLEMDKGVRLVEYSRGWKMASTCFAWNSPGAREWRAKVKQFGARYGAQSLADMKRIFGSKWAYLYGPCIVAEEIGDSRQVERGAVV
jgi:hypothetical protein